MDDATHQKKRRDNRGAFVFAFARRLLV